MLASWGTHDLPRFVSYLSGDDIDEQEQEGNLTPTDGGRGRAADGRTGAPHCSGPSVSTTVSTTAAWPALALRGCLLHLASSAADLRLVDLEDLWGEHEPQNRPGTGVGAANWRRRGRAHPGAGAARQSGPQSSYGH